MSLLEINFWNINLPDFCLQHLQVWDIEALQWAIITAMTSKAAKGFSRNVLLRQVNFTSIYYIFCFPPKYKKINFNYTKLERMHVSNNG